MLEQSQEHLLSFTKNFPCHSRQFAFEEFNEISYNKMYEETSDVVPRQNFFNEIPAMKDVCSECWKFYLSPRNKSLKFMDIKLGKLFENEFKQFLISLGFNCFTIEELELRKNYPDLAIVDEEKTPIVFLEMKYLTAPFVKVYKMVPGRECYEGSTTLDADEKLETQIKIITEEINVPTYYVYWIDYPCIKGIFFIDSKNVISHFEKYQTEWTRKSREGDYVKGVNGKIRVGHRKKIYLPLLKMSNFEELINILNESVKNRNENRPT